MLLGDLERQRRAVDAGVVHQDVDPPKLGAGALYHGGEGRARGDVGRHDAGTTPQGLHLTGCALSIGTVQLSDDDVGTQPRQFKGGGTADAASRTSDDGDLSFQLH